MKPKIKKAIRKNKFLNKLYCFFSNKKNSRIQKKENVIFQKNGEKVFLSVCLLLNKLNVNYFADMGTLLGIIREGHLLNHDKDLDFGLFIEQKDVSNFISSLEKNGLIFKEAYDVENIGITQVSFFLKKVRIDFNIYTSSANGFECYLFYLKSQREPLVFYDVVKLVLNKDLCVEEKEYNNVIIKVPADSKEYLSCRYGKDWNIPNKNYVYWKGPSAVPINNKGYIIKRDSLK